MAAKIALHVAGAIGGVPYLGTRFTTTWVAGTLRKVPDKMGVENYWPWGPSVADINADGWQDIFIASSMNFPFRYGINSMLLNNRGEKNPLIQSSCSISNHAATGGRIRLGLRSIARSLTPTPTPRSPAKDRRAL